MFFYSMLIIILNMIFSASLLKILFEESTSKFQYNPIVRKTFTYCIKYFYIIKARYVGEK